MLLSSLHFYLSAFLPELELSVSNLARHRQVLWAVQTMFQVDAMITP